MNHSVNVCADCSAPDPSWASLNRGVLLCNECCSVHRSLGRHISNIRSVHSPHWPPVLKEMVFTLINKGANSLWEHLIHDGHSKVKLKKPSPRDKLHPNKHDFIVAKYKNLAFLPRFSHKDSPSSVEDLSKQLHASVRTSNLETCLRLLSLGANPNYVHPDRGNTPLHVAAHAGQAMQVELLFLYNANPCTLDRLGHTPEECARIAGHHQLADRLIECQYEVTDKLSIYLCGRRPVHTIGEHYLVPQIAGTGLNIGLTEARSRLQELGNELFEELAADVYDEADRRESDAIWLTTQQLHSSVAFLPVNPTLSPMRNQGRQKLATLDAKQYTQLVVDILLDAKRRQLISLETGQTSGTAVPSTSDDQAEAFDHDYDEPPADTYAQVSEVREGSGERGGLAGSEDGPQPEYAEVQDRESRARPPSLPRASRVEGEGRGGGGADVEEKTVSRTKFDLLKDRLKVVQSEKEELQVANEGLQARLDEMQKQLNQIIQENAVLRSAQQQVPSPTSPPSRSPLTHSPPPTIEEDKPLELLPPQAPTLIYAQVNKRKKKSSTSSQPSPPNEQTSPPRGPTPTSPQRATPPNNDLTLLHTKKSSVSSGALTPPPIRQDTPLSDSAFEEAPPPEGLRMEEIHSHIKNITQCIQELLQAAQSQRRGSFSSCCQKIMRAVETMTKSFLARPTSQEVQVSLREVRLAVQRLQSECQNLGHSDVAFRSRHVINSAYDVAKAARHLVVVVEQERSPSVEQ